jgi:SHS2 domain-containing protein
VSSEITKKSLREGGSDVRQPFIEIDHSGDVGIEAHGATVPELLENATLGLFSLLYRGKVQSLTERVIHVESDSLEDLVVDWLGEVIAMGGLHGELYGTVEVHKAGRSSADGVLRGEPFDRSKHDPRFDVKAATYHELSITEEDDGLCVRVIFDL